MTIRDILAITALALILMPIICFTASVIIGAYFARREEHMKKVANDDSFWDIIEKDEIEKDGDENDGDT